uniref:Uncharacterized protein n=1 Tax=Meloidogyne enterolobii TaxID=390850 RepID=A0A6V7TYP6_MELEN|nr:unnamed protein product [Meloidogyne enterolobii]
MSGFGVQKHPKLIISAFQAKICIYKKCAEGMENSIFGPQAKILRILEGQWANFLPFSFF